MNTRTGKVVILGAGRPYRSSLPSALVFTSGNQRVLDWVIAAFAHLEPAEFCFVGGYRVDEIIRLYPHLRITVNSQWASSGSAGSLLAAPLGETMNVYVCYADIVFSAAVVDELRSTPGDIVLAVDRRWRDRYPDRSEQDRRIAEKVRLRGDEVADVGRHIPVAEADAEFIGVCRLSPKALRALARLDQREHLTLLQADVPTLLMRLAGLGLTLRAVDVRGNWAELNDPGDLAHFVLGTKAETLENLAGLVRRSVIGEVLRFTAGQWRSDRDAVVRSVRERFPGGLLAVRSSSIAEDGWAASAAGCYRSLLNVDAASPAAVVDAVESVLASYGDDDPRHQVLVQPMLRDVRLSGVLTTRTLNHGAPYYTINFDDRESSTDSVTSGSCGGLRTLVVARFAAALPPGAPAGLDRLLDAARELEQLVGHDALDIEFALSRDNTVHVLQLRPIAVRHGYRWIADSDVRRALVAAADEFRRHATPAPHLFGSQALYGVMPDWNPAEIIGPKPRRLALSLYRYLVTDHTWATQRAEYGYRDVRPQPLVMTFAGHPYVDVRASFNSFIPAALSDDLAGRLVEHYLAQLRAQPHLHDKIEFDVAFTCYAFDFDQAAAERLAPAGFSAADIAALRQALLKITANAARRADADLQPIELLTRRREAVLAAHLPPLERARLLLDDCLRLGTLPFAHLARGAFVATALLRSLESRGLLPTAEKEAFLGAVQTVVRDIKRDGGRVAAGEMPWETFVAKYGHLRPGTYDITSPRYGEDPERYLRQLVAAPDDDHVPDAEHAWSRDTQRRVAQALEESGLGLDLPTLQHFMLTAIRGREYSKFVFTANLSAALDALVEFGRTRDLSREALSHLSIEELLRGRLETPLGDADEELRRRAEHEMELHRVSQVIELPPLVTRVEDFEGFEVPPSQPNFVTRHRVTGPVVEVDADGVDLRGRIALVPSADPGFDWLFSHEIAGLITMYGGSNSHMTIRAAELDLPAAIGVGEALYRTLAAATMIDLDCGARRLRVLA